MLFDFTIPKVGNLSAYDAHLMVSKLFQEKRNLFFDSGDFIRVRSEKSELNGYQVTPVPEPNKNDVIFIELRASCYVSSGGKKYFLKQGDWKARHSWLERKGATNGFEVLTVTCQSKLLRVPKPGAAFSLDCTDFTACFKVTNKDIFATALRDGVGSKGRAFGFGMMIL